MLNFLGFGVNLVQLGSQLGLKIEEKSFQEASKSEVNLHLIFDAYFFIDFGSLLGRFLVDFWCEVESCWFQKLVKNRYLQETEKKVKI